MTQTDHEKVVARRKYMRDYMRKRALDDKTVRKFPGKPRLNPYHYNGDADQNNVRFKTGSYRISFD